MSHPRTEHSRGRACTDVSFDSGGGRGRSDRLIKEIGRRHAREAEALWIALPYGLAR
ncbi:hypothetical protein AB0J63_01955 [Streptosporangium canum]|uniref:hypothetical protein n=1 Tax=Streptosporangium canum TaxID=324952 RepID=UPI00343D50D4